MVKETDVKEMLAKLYNQEFTESGSSEGKLQNGMSVEDVKFIKIMEDGAKMVNKHYQITLPFRNPNIQLPNNGDYHTYKKGLTKNKEFEKD